MSAPSFIDRQEDRDLRLVFRAGEEPPHPSAVAVDCDEPDECTCPRGASRCRRSPMGGES